MSYSHYVVQVLYIKNKPLLLFNSSEKLEDLDIFLKILKIKTAHFPVVKCSVYHHLFYSPFFKNIILTCI